MEIIIGFHSPEIFDVLFLCWLVWVSLYLFSIFWCIYFPLETKTDNEVSFIQRLQKSWFFCIFLKKIKVFRPETIEQEIGHSALNRICIIAGPVRHVNCFGRFQLNFCLTIFLPQEKVGTKYLISFRKRVLFSQNLGCGLICGVNVCPVQKQGKSSGSL